MTNENPESSLFYLLFFLFALCLFLCCGHCSTPFGIPVDFSLKPPPFNEIGTCRAVAKKKKRNENNIDAREVKAKKNSLVLWSAGKSALKKGFRWNKGRLRLAAVLGRCTQTDAPQGAMEIGRRSS